MRRISLLVIGCVFYAAFSSQPVYSENSQNVEGKLANKTKVCEPKESFKEDCNTCWCNDDGTDYFCTRRVCVGNIDDTSDRPEETRVIKKECRPREVFELDCNTCRCNDDGHSFSCTTRTCVTDAPPDAVSYEAEEAEGLSTVRLRRQVEPTKALSKTCDPTTEFRIDCNTCLCHTDGQSFSCTRHDCTKQGRSARRRREVREERVDCEAGSVFNRECNVCRCAGDGRKASCTNNKCQHVDNNAPKPETGFRCTPGEQFKRSCNDCTCSADGKSVFCTLKLCEDEVVAQV